MFPYQPCLAIYHIYGALMASLCAQAAASTFFFINMYNLSNHNYPISVRGAPVISLFFLEIV
jgi:hypothetical protein